MLVDQRFELPGLLLGETAVLQKSGHKLGQQAVKRAVDHALTLIPLDLLPADQRGDDRVLILKDAAVRELLQDGVDSGALPAEPLETELGELSRADRFVFPDQADEFKLAVVELEIFYGKSSFLCLSR